MNVKLTTDMSLSNCIYRFINKNNEIIYIGKAKNLRDRLNKHTHLSNECYKEIDRIEFTVFESEDEMDLAERYYIPRYKPKYNEIMVKRNINFPIEILDNVIWYEYKNFVKKQEIRDQIISMSEPDLKNQQYDSNSKYMQYARENDDDYDINKENPDLFDNLIINMISILTREINKNNIELSIKTSTLNKFEKKIYEKNIYPKIQRNINPIYINIKKVAEEMLLSDDEVIVIFSNLIMHYIVIYTKGLYCQSRIFNDILIGNGFVKLRVCNI